jgi:tetratricopeptide (TPR) repeat protein
LNNLTENLGQYISINSFLFANTDRDKALQVFSTLKSSTDLQHVLFEIDASPALINIKPFGLISSQTEFIDQSEVLFMAASIFSLDEVTRNDDQLWIVKITLCNDQDYHSILNSIQINQQNENQQTNLRTLAKILWKMDKLDLAEDYYNRLIKELPLNDPFLMIIYDDLGKMTLQNGNYDDSVQWFRKSIEIKKQNPPTGDTYMDESNIFIGKFINSYQIIMNFCRIESDAGEKN